MKEAKKYLHKTQDPENAHKNKSIVMCHLQLICYWNRKDSLSVKG